MNENTSQKRNNHNIFIAVETIYGLGCVLVSISQGWEYWVPPLILIGIGASWWMHFAQYRQERIRENYYLIFCMLVAFYHGVHESSFFDVFAISAIMLSLCTLLRRREFMHFYLIEFLILMALQVWLAYYNGTNLADSLLISRLALHVIADFCVYRTLLIVIDELDKRDNEIAIRDNERERINEVMEDFLVNLSHELRTPVNVINGMSTLILKREERNDVSAILDAGLRLSRQIEDIQDYSEVRRGNVILEQEPYMITSLLNDVLVNLENTKRRGNLELVVDLSPEVPSIMKGDAKKFQKILLHLLDNAFKFSQKGGVFLRIKAIPRDYGVNLVFEVKDTGIGMNKKDIDGISKGLYQANKKRNRSTGGIGLGLSVVYGFIRQMGGFVAIESQKNVGTTVRISVAQEVVDPSPCLSTLNDRYVSAAYFMMPDKFKVKAVGEYYRSMATHMAKGLRINLYLATTLNELEKLIKKNNITHVFMGQEEYEANRSYFDRLSETDVTVAVSAESDSLDTKGGKVIKLPKPIYAFPLVRVLNGVRDTKKLSDIEDRHRPVLDGLKVLVVDDEPMNLVVATGLFKDYQMITETANNGKEAISKFEKKDYDVIFLDHMMPEMDGVETLKRLKKIAEQKSKNTKYIALTANAVSGAREMFLREGFDGFIRKPIDIGEFERTMWDAVPRSHSEVKGGRS